MIITGNKAKWYACPIYGQYTEVDQLPSATHATHGADLLHNQFYGNFMRDIYTIDVTQ